MLSIVTAVGIAILADEEYLGFEVWLEIALITLLVVVGVVVSYYIIQGS